VTVERTGRPGAPGSSRRTWSCWSLGLPDMTASRCAGGSGHAGRCRIIVLSARGRSATRSAPRRRRGRLRDQAVRIGRTAGASARRPPPEVRQRQPASGQWRRGDLVIDFDRRASCAGDEEIRLTRRSSTAVAARPQPGRVLTSRRSSSRYGGRTQSISRSTYGCSWSLRKKSSASRPPRYLITEPWVGYRFAGDDD